MAALSVRAFAVRLPAVVCGSLLLVSVYVLTVQVFGKNVFGERFDWPGVQSVYDRLRQVEHRDAACFQLAAIWLLRCVDQSEAIDARLAARAEKEARQATAEADAGKR